MVLNYESVLTVLRCMTMNGLKQIIIIIIIIVYFFYTATYQYNVSSCAVYIVSIIHKNMHK